MTLKANLKLLGINEFSVVRIAEPGRFKLKPEMSKTTFASLRSWLIDNLLLVVTFSGVFIGVLSGILLKPLDLDKEAVAYIAYPGELFMRLLKLMILPLIIASLITGNYNTTYKLCTIILNCAVSSLLQYLPVASLVVDITWWKIPLLSFLMAPLTHQSKKASSLLTDVRPCLV